MKEKKKKLSNIELSEIDINNLNVRFGISRDKGLHVYFSQEVYDDFQKVSLELGLSRQKIYQFFAEDVAVREPVSINLIKKYVIAENNRVLNQQKTSPAGVPNCSSPLYKKRKSIHVYFHRKDHHEFRKLCLNINVSMQMILQHFAMDVISKSEVTKNLIERYIQKKNKPFITEETHNFDILDENILYDAIESNNDENDI